MAPPTEPCALRSNQPLKVSTRDFSWVKGRRCVRLTTYYPCETSRKSGALIYPKPPGVTSASYGRPLLYFNHYTQLKKTRMSTNIRISVGKSPRVHLLQCNTYIDTQRRQMHSRMNDFVVCTAIASIFFKEVKLRDLKIEDDSPNPASWKISARKHRTIMPENKLANLYG